MRRGNARRARALYMAAFCAIKFNPVIQRLAERLRGAGKPFKVVVVAAMRKLLTILNIMLKENEPWNPKLQTA
jgi:transposase